MPLDLERDACHNIRFEKLNWGNGEVGKIFRSSINEPGHLVLIYVVRGFAPIPPHLILGCLLIGNANQRHYLRPRNERIAKRT
jgi:hypothetical protein